MLASRTFAKIVRVIPLGMLTALLLGCGGEATPPAPPAPPAILSDARLADADKADLDKLRAFGGDEVIVSEGEDQLAIYLSADTLTDVNKIDSLLPVVARIPNISRLYLTNTPVTDSGLETLTGMEMLETINLDGSKITDLGLVKLGELPNLKTVFCRNTAVTVSGAAGVREEKGILITH